ncbi:unnamed protein product [Brassica rapa subsp. trilocularis]
MKCSMKTRIETRVESEVSKDTCRNLNKRSTRVARPPRLHRQESPPETAERRITRTPKARRKT